MPGSPIIVEEIEPAIVQVTMAEREHKNTFTEAFTEGLVDAFQAVRSNATYKVAVLTGYDTYFASGGTREGLFAIHEGRAKFTDANIYALALDCKIPVISAMHGHAIGGGFVLGLFSDFVVLGRESVYTTNFMKYGFTPGMGATAILPEKLGRSLATEMLFTAETYRGAQLEKRGVGFPVVPRADGLTYAHTLARQVAAKPRESLIVLKDHLVRGLRESLPRFIEQELVMHGKTIHQPEVKERIEALFGM